MMRLISIFILLLTLTGTRAGFVFSDDSCGDDHAGFPAAKARYQSNNVAHVLRHLVVTNDNYSRVAGFIGINTRHGDCIEDDRSLTNSYDNGTNAVYSGFQMTNDYRILATCGAMFFINDGNHDANNTNNTYGSTFYTHPAPTNLWNVMFPPPFWTNQTRYFYTNWPPSQYNNMAMKYETNGLKLLYISYHTDASTNSFNDKVYTNQTEQIRAIMRANPDYNVIIKQHFALGQSATSFNDIVPSYMDHNSGYSNYSIGPGRAPIDGGLQDEPNFLGIEAGHNVPVWKGIYIGTNRWGRQWFVVQFNTQSSGQNGDFHNVLTFDTGRSTVTCNTYCVSEDRWLTDYETTGNWTNVFTNGYFPSFRHTFPTAGGEIPLPCKPPVALILMR